MAEYTSSGSNTPENRYVHGDGADVPLVQYNGASISASSRRFLHVNHQGSIIAHTGDGGNVTVTNAYDPYGIPEVGNQGRFGYTGQVWLPELGLYHYKARMYEPRLGRFLQTDPIFYEDQMNMYAYVGNDPVNKIDPTGMYDVHMARSMADAHMWARKPGNMEALGEGIKDAAGAVASGDRAAMAAAGEKIGMAVLVGAFAMRKGPKISNQKQNAHVAGTKENARRNESGTPTSTFDDRKAADRLTADTVATGTASTDANGTTTYRKDYGERVGTGPNGGSQNQVKVHQDSRGVCHGHPCGPES